MVEFQYILQEQVDRENFQGMYQGSDEKKFLEFIVYCYNTLPTPSLTCKEVIQRMVIFYNTMQKMSFPLNYLKPKSVAFFHTGFNC